MDPHNLQRFVDAQRDVYERVEMELRAGRKETHWMWFIFPQIAGLGHSSMAQKFAMFAIRRTSCVSRAGREKTVRSSLRRE